MNFEGTTQRALLVTQELNHTMNDGLLNCPKTETGNHNITRRDKVETINYERDIDQPQPQNQITGKGPL